MANHRQGNVLFVDTTDTDFADVRRIKSIKYIGNSSGTATIKSAEGDVLWEESGTANVYNAEVCIYSSNGIEVEVTNGATVYLYLG